MSNVKKIQSQIFAIKKRIKEGKVKNIIPAERKIEALKNDLKIALEQQYWRNLESI
jgi:hypothetical protein